METTQVMGQTKDIPFRDRVLSFIALCIAVVVALSAAIIETVIVPFGGLLMLGRWSFYKKINWDWLYFVTRYFSLPMILILLITTFESKEVIDLLP